MEFRKLASTDPTDRCSQKNLFYTGPTDRCRLVLHIFIPDKKLPQKILIQRHRSYGSVWACFKKPEAIPSPSSSVFFEPAATPFFFNFFFLSSQYNQPFLNPIVSKFLDRLRDLETLQIYSFDKVNIPHFIIFYFNRIKMNN